MIEMERDRILIVVFLVVAVLLLIVIALDEGETCPPGATCTSVCSDGPRDQADPCEDGFAYDLYLDQRRYRCNVSEHVAICDEVEPVTVSTDCACVLDGVEYPCGGHAECPAPSWMFGNTFESEAEAKGADE